MRIFLSVLITGLITVLLSACGPIYQTKYDYVAPTTNGGNRCVAQCEQNKAMCEQMSQYNAEGCKQRAHENALADFNAYKTERLRRNEPIEKSVGDFDNSRRCDVGDHCSTAYDSCYTACGGKIVTRKVCVAFCDKA